MRNAPSPSFGSSRRGARLLVPALLAAPLLACGSSSSNDGGSGATGNVVLTNATNYTVPNPSLTIPVIPTAAGMDLQLCWGDIQKNLLCHATSDSANSIDNIGFAVVPHISQSALEDKLASGQDVTPLVTTYGQLKTSQATSPSTNCTALSSLVSQTSTTGGDINPATDLVESSSTNYLVLATHGTIEGAGAQAMVFLQPSSTVTTTMVNIPDPCAGDILNFSATLGSPVSVPTAGPWKLDWSEVTRDGFGNMLNFASTKIDKVEVGFYEGKTAADLQTHFVDLDQPTFYTSLYQVAVPANQKWVDLAGAKDVSTNAALAFDRTDGIWAVAVLCSTCSLPAPIVFTPLTLTP